MPFDVALLPGEELVLNELYVPKRKADRIGFAVSTRAIFLPRKKTFAFVDPWYFQRVDLSDAPIVFLQRMSTLPTWSLAVLMVALGLSEIYLSLDRANARDPGLEEGIALVGGGLYLPFAARGRYSLKVRFANGFFEWRPRMMIDEPSTALAVRFQERILEACRRVGVEVRDERRAA